MGNGWGVSNLCAPSRGIPGRAFFLWNSERKITPRIFGYKDKDKISVISDDNSESDSSENDNGECRKKLNKQIPLEQLTLIDIYYIQDTRII